VEAERKRLEDRQEIDQIRQGTKKAETEKSEVIAAKKQSYLKT